VPVVELISEKEIGEFFSGDVFIDNILSISAFKRSCNNDISPFLYKLIGFKCFALSNVDNVPNNDIEAKFLAIIDRFSNEKTHNIFLLV